MRVERHALDALLEQLRAEPKQTRIRFREQIAAFGAEAVEPMRAWLSDPALGAFAVRVLEEVARKGDRTAAVRALQAGRPGVSPIVTRDIDEALGRLGVQTRPPSTSVPRSDAPPGSRVWLLRMVPVGRDRVEDALAANVITIGWGKPDGLVNLGLSREQFRDEVIRAYYQQATDLRAAGTSNGQLWRFIREMSAGDLVVVPRGDALHFARVAGDVSHDQRPEAEHWAFSRPVAWLTSSSGVPRNLLPDEVLHTLRWQGTCLEISAHRRAIMEAVPETQ